MYQVLFVCTGNVFRSLTAEYALRDCLGPNTTITTSSAGTDDLPDLIIRPEVKEYLRIKGVDVSNHKRRTLTREILCESNLIIAMSTDHQSYLIEHFELHAPVFTKACGKAAEPLHDVDEVLPESQLESHTAILHIQKIVDKIFDLTPDLVENIKLKN
jgi:protein-tyrosine-phosphatase